MNQNFSCLVTCIHGLNFINPHLPQAIPLLKDSIKKAYGKKGDKIVNMNNAAVDMALDKLIAIDIPEGWRVGEVRWLRVCTHACVREANTIDMCGVCLLTIAPAWNGSGAIACSTCLAALACLKGASCASGTCSCGLHACMHLHNTHPLAFLTCVLLHLHLQNAPEFIGTAEKAVSITGASSPTDFLNQVVIPMLAMEGDKLPVRCVVSTAWQHGGQAW